MCDGGVGGVGGAPHTEPPMIKSLILERIRADRLGRDGESQLRSTPSRHVTNLQSVRRRRIPIIPKQERVGLSEGRFLIGRYLV